MLATLMSGHWNAVGKIRKYQGIQIAQLSIRYTLHSMPGCHMKCVATFHDFLEL